MTVSVHWNLHKRCWSIKQGEEPIRHVPSLALVNVTFRVWRAAREKMVAAKCRAVHAFAIGTLRDFTAENLDMPSLVRVRYNPYVAGHFWIDGGTRVDRCQLAYFMSDGTLWGLL